MYRIVLVSLFATLAAGVITPYVDERECEVENIPLADITGTWHALYHHNATIRSYQLELSKLDADTLSVWNRTIDENGALVVNNNFNITRSYPEMGGELAQIVQLDTYSVSLPWFFLAIDPKHYMTLFYVDKDYSDSYAIFTREAKLEQPLFELAAQGLICDNQIDSSGKARVYQLATIKLP